MTALAALGDDDLRVFATSTLEPKQLTMGSEILVAYNVYLTIFETLGEFGHSLYDQLEADMEVIGMNLMGLNKQELAALFSKP